MKRLFIVGISVIFILLTVNPALALMWGNDLVSVGDTKYEVLKKCGQPVHKEFLGVAEARKYTRKVQTGGDVKVEVWIYEASQLNSMSWDYQFIFVGLELVELIHISPHWFIINGRWASLRIRPSIRFIFVFLFFFPTLSLADQLRVVLVNDGDTIKGAADHMEIIVRLVGIDAPETSKKKNEPGQPYSIKATRYLANLVLKKTITIKEYGADRYGRIWGLVFFHGTNANLEMVKAGFAEVYRGKHARYFNPKIYQDAEAKAKKEKRGMWVLGDKYISPRDWRRGRRN